jgi:hypothetical protein
VASFATHGSADPFFFRLVHQLQVVDSKRLEPTPLIEPGVDDVCFAVLATSFGRCRGPEVAVSLKEPAWKLIPASRADAHPHAPTQCRSTMSCNNDVPWRLPLHHHAARGSGRHAVLTQCQRSIAPESNRLASAWASRSVKSTASSDMICAYRRLSTHGRNEGRSA